MRIGELARRVGLRPSAIRYYEAHGILGPAARSANEYRLYGSDAVVLLRFVQRARKLGLSLHEVRQIAEAAREGTPCYLTRKVIEHHLSEVEGELQRLRLLRGRLERLLRETPKEAADCVCPLIEHGGISI
ncbi:MAG: MerR family transcriptional regulator [Acetobacteraceae bacterium]